MGNKWFWAADFKGFPNGASFINIAHCIAELLSISKISSESECTIATYYNSIHLAVKMANITLL